MPSREKSKSHLNTALTYKNEKPKFSLSEKQYTELENLYTIYDNVNGEHDEQLKSNSFSKEEKQAIHDAYGEVQINNRLSDLRSELLHLTDRCPCCSISACEELDHHLPRSIYHVLAVYSRNLVPICHKCNNKKRTVTGEDPNERFVHPYFSAIPKGIKILKATSTIQNEKLNVKFYIDEKAKVDRQLITQLKFQTEKVGLFDRLKKEINTCLVSYFVSFKNAYGSKKNSKAVKKTLEENAKHLIKQYDYNDWRVALLDSLAECKEYCNGGFLKIGEKPSGK